MFSLKSDDHLLLLANELYEDDLFSDIVFITENGTFSGHSSLIFQILPSLFDLVCQGCKSGHEKIVIILPGVKADVLEIALQEFYIRGNPTKLSDVLGVSNVNKQSEPAKTSKDTDSQIIEDEAFNESNNTSKDSIVELGQNNYETEMLLGEFDKSEYNFDALTKNNLDVSENNFEGEEELFNEDIVKEELLDAEETESTKHLYSNQEENIVEAVEKVDPSFNSISGLLNHMKENFLPIISFGLERKIRPSIMEAVLEKKELTARQSLAVLNSMNIQVFKLIGNVNPDPALCRCLARLLKENIPETFALQRDLAERVGDSFSDKYLEGSDEDQDSHAPLENVALNLANWLKEFKKNFRRDIIEKSSYNVREAVEKNTSIDNVRERRDIRNMIINATVLRLKEIFEGDSIPRLKEIREIAEEMEFVYPAMFRNENAGTGYGLGGSRGADGLASHIADRLRNRKKGSNKKGALSGEAKYEIGAWTQGKMPTTSKLAKKILDTPSNNAHMVSTPHTNPDWLTDLRKYFKNEIIDKCAVNVREAVDRNETIEDLRERRDIRNNIINSVVSHLVKIFGGVSRPRVSDVREIVVEMQFTYPAMFKEDVGSGYGYGGSKGIKGLANHMLDRVNKRIVGANKKMGELISKKGKKKKKIVYGVNNDIWYSAFAQSNDASIFKHLMHGQSFDAREKIFEANRSELTALLRDHNDAIPRLCTGFFSNYRHLENQFKYLTSTAGLTNVVVQNFSREMDNLEAYLACTNVEVDLPEYYEGAPEFKYVDILRKAGDNFDSAGAALVRLEADGPPVSDSPFILAVLSDRSISFELWVCRSRILGNLSITQAIASFLHLAFVCNLQYPKECQTLADIWQRRFGLYGDYSGTRTRSKVDAAKNKIDKYLNTLSKLYTRDE